MNDVEIDNPGTTEETLDQFGCLDSIAKSYMMYTTTDPGPDYPTLNGRLECTNKNLTRDFSFHCNETTVVIASTSQGPTALDRIQGNSVYKYYKKEESGSYGYKYELWYYLCNDSIVYNYVDNYNGVIRSYYSWGTNLSLDCSSQQFSDNYEPLFCEQGPNQRMCYNSFLKRDNQEFDLSDNNDIVYSISESVINIELDGSSELFFLKIDLPLDENFELAPGNYRIGSNTPPEDFPVLNVETLIAPFYTITQFNEFDDGGLLTVTETGEENEYGISFNFPYCEEAVWTGYFTISM